jgi:hypothetical protein
MSSVASGAIRVEVLGENGGSFEGNGRDVLEYLHRMSGMGRCNMSKMGWSDLILEKTESREKSWRLAS